MHAEPWVSCRTVDVHVDIYICGCGDVSMTEGGKSILCLSYVMTSDETGNMYVTI